MAKLSGLQIKPEALGHALSDNRLAVPIYQRSYAWKSDHVRDLYQDFARAIADGAPEYFLGSIVVTTQTNGRPEIVDGQQRLATATILLAAIRDHFHRSGDSEGARILEEKYLQSRDLKTRVVVPKLRLNDFDQEFFSDYVLTTPEDERRKAAERKRDSHKRIANAVRIAAQHVKDIVKPYDASHHADHLNRWVDFVHHGAQVIWVQVPECADAFVIFETLNDRGLDLSIADLLKNYLFGRAGRERIQGVQQKWAEMIGVLETVSSKDIAANYIHQLWSSVHGLTRSRDLFSEIRARVKNAQAAVDFSGALVDHAKLYAALRNPEHEYWNPFGASIRKALRELNLLRVWQIRTVLLAVLAAFDDSEIKKAIKISVAWSVRYLVAGGSSGTIERHYARLAANIREGKLTSCSDLNKALAGIIPDDEKFRLSFARATVSTDYLGRYYLSRLNAEIGRSGGSGPVDSMDEQEFNLEHIYPKSPSDQWSHIPEDVGRENVRRLGNMALVRASVNSRLGNAGPAEKLVAFASEPLPFTKALGDYDSWGIEQIELQQSKMADIAIRAWPI